MKSAGMKCFKPKWLHRFPCLLIYDGKFIRAVAETAQIDSSLDIGKREDKDEGSQNDFASAEIFPDHANIRLGPCLKPAIGNAKGKSRKVRWATFLDQLSFKPGNSVSVLMQTGRDVKLPVVFNPPEKGLIPLGYFKRGEGRIAKTGLGTWRDFKLLAAEEDDEAGTIRDVEKLVDDCIELPMELDSDDDVEISSP